MKKTPSRNCGVCLKPISKGRLQAIPDTKTCVKCSHVPVITVRNIEVDGVAPDDLVDSVSQQQD